MRSGQKIQTPPPTKYVNNGLLQEYYSQADSALLTIPYKEKMWTASTYETPSKIAFKVDF